MLEIIEARPAHYDAIWEIFHDVVKRGDTYTYPPDITKQEALDLWCHGPGETFVALSQGKVVGTYIMKPNFPGLGSHVANCSYMVGKSARGLGVGRSMAEHSLNLAKDSGYLSMQFNVVVATNHAAIKLWQSLVFDIIGTIPKGFNHQEIGLVDAYIMHRQL